MPKTAKEGLLDWLRGTGYPFQLQAGRTIEKAGWFVTQSRWYRDPETEKPREIDLEAIGGTARAGEAYFFVHLVIECKVIQSPWVGIRSAPDREPLTYTATSPGTMSRRLAHACNLLEISLPSLLPDDLPEVDALITGFGDKQDTRGTKAPKAKPKEGSDPTSPYAAIAQVTTAVIARDQALLPTAVKGLPNLHTATLVLPVVLIQGSLFTYTIDSDLSDHLTEVDALIVRQPAPADEDYSTVAVMTEGYAKTVLPRALLDARRFTSDCLSHSGRLAHSLLHPVRDIADHLGDPVA